MQSATVPGELRLSKPTPPTAGQPWRTRWRAACQGALEKLAPLGYQDQTGFHFGPEPAAQPEPAAG
jgi:hypothetical protein